MLLYDNYDLFGSEKDPIESNQEGPHKKEKGHHYLLYMFTFKTDSLIEHTIFMCAATSSSFSKAI